MALALQIQNDRRAADAALQKLIDENAVSGPFQIATVYGLRKEPDKMFEWLERAYTEHDPGLTQLLGTPFILNYRDDQRFAALIIWRTSSVPNESNLCPSCRKQPPARSRSISFAASPRFRSSDRPNDVAILTIRCDPIL